MRKYIDIVSEGLESPLSGTFYHGTSTGKPRSTSGLYVGNSLRWASYYAKNAAEQYGGDPVVLKGTVSVSSPAWVSDDEIEQIGYEADDISHLIELGHDCAAREDEVEVFLFSHSLFHVQDEALVESVQLDEAFGNPLPYKWVARGERRWGEINALGYGVRSSGETEQGINHTILPKKAPQMSEGMTRMQSDTGIDIAVTTNPSSSQTRALLTRHRELRGIIDQNGVMFIWDASHVEHGAARMRLGLDPKWAFYLRQREDKVTYEFYDAGAEDDEAITGEPAFERATRNLNLVQGS